MANKKKLIWSGRGRMPSEMRSFIDRNHERMTSEQMAIHLGNSECSPRIQKYIYETFGDQKKIKKELTLAEELENRPEYDNFRRQFTPDELSHFRNRYVQLMSQFRDDMLVTDEMTIFQVISVDILIQRTLIEQNIVNQDMVNSHKEMEHFKAEFEQYGDKNLIDQIRSAEMRYAKMGDSLKNLNARYESLSMRQSAMLKELKATRDQRMKVMENSKQNFVGLLRSLAEEDQRAMKGREAELMKMSMKKDEKRLSRPHTYIDGSRDQPLLTPETVLDDLD